MSVCKCAMTNEELLTEYLKTKDQELFTILYKRMYRPAYALAKRILHSPEDAEDIAQDVFCKLCELDPEPEPIRSAESFLFKMVQNLSLNLHRDDNTGVREGMVSLTKLKSAAAARHADGQKGATTNADLLEEPIDNRVESSDEHLQRQELWEETKLVLDRLPANQREAIEAYYGRGLEIDEIAESFELPWHTVRTRIRRGMATLRQTLAPENTDMTIRRPARRPSKPSSAGEYANAV